MKTVKTIVAAALAASCAFAQSDNATVTQAASNPSTIHNAVAELSGVTIQAFAAEVIDAIAAKPQSPVSKVFDLVAAASNFLAESDESNLADVIVAMISNVPFEALPEWTTLMLESVQNTTRDIEETAYNKLVSDVVEKIGELDGYEEEDKVVVTAFAIKLLFRGKEGELDEYIDMVIAAVPGSYRNQVQGAARDVMGGDYSSVLTGVDIIVIPTAGEVDVGGTTPGGGTTEGDEGFEGTEDGDSLVVKTPEEEQEKPQEKPQEQEKPPVTPPYSGQF
ncbi:MAG: hypothetical protein IKO40_11975 [Kiritimatiellae bacterium]|nr:hypothetical protein [Kiritimatiellia bacterium]